jgi:two-component system, NtrC family, sensor kinase
VLSVVALVPIVVFGLLGLGSARYALAQRLEASQAQLARQAVDLTETRLRLILDIIRRNASITDFDANREDVLTGFLRVIYRQSDAITIVSLIDEEGVAVVPSVYLEDPSSHDSLRHHLPVRDSDLELHGRNIPLDAALTSGAAIGPPYGEPGHPRMALAVETQRGSDGRRFVLFVEITLESIDEQLRQLGGTATEVILLRQDGRAVLDGRGPFTLPGSASSRALPERAVTGRVARSDGWDLIAYSPAPLLGLGLIVRRDENEALAPLNRLRRQGIFWASIGVILSFLLAFLVARDLSMRIEELDRHANALAQGDFDQRIAIRSRDELGRLAAAFNGSASELRAQRDKIEAQNREILAWNEELEKRVAQKTDQLAKAQEIILRSRRLAGLGVFGAGLAHEVNNPLTTTLGFIQLLARDESLKDSQRLFLKEAEQGALRIRTIVDELRKLADSESTPSFGDVDLSEVVEQASRSVTSQMREKSIELTLDVPKTVPLVRGNREQLVEALIHLLSNAHQAVAEDGKIGIRVTTSGNQLVMISVEDNGRGIYREHLDRVFDPFFTTKSDWEAKGLGLSIVNRIAEDHAGSIELESEPGKGTTASLLLPIAHATRHLA